MSEIATTPKPPYYAVIFTSHRNEEDKAYSKMADKMVTLASKQPGFLGVESARESIGITVSYWSDLDAIKNWKINTDHLNAQQKGRDLWYQEFKIRISKVERDYGMDKD
ncbi:MAG: antibiotic biosynthesis monooxygenase [Gammaproteobacteria bacterium]|nr:antibiotic biosynthesis monooxygenase [Gammaproteobacteria bacterium]